MKEECVCCSIETNGTYGEKFPVCFDCYENGNLIKIFKGLNSRYTMRFSKSFVKYIDEVTKAAVVWKSGFVRIENDG